MKLQLLILCCVFGSIVGGKLPDFKGNLLIHSIRNKKYSKNNFIVNFFDFMKTVGRPPLTGRIVGGADAAEGQAPYQCSIQKNGDHFCGCAILSSKHILTAAHCIQM